ncbi:UDP-N-acetylglucosamine 2-epimerase [uncultured Roseivirga sp.]|uniref:UDP-N-acetylglucosamine 2-epimerase n=1 Tax=uncultured Roseivirga sp. TaxID=543088 RepID=UPI0032B1B2A5
MNKRRICVVVTARPSYSRIKTAMLAMKEHPEIELQVVLAASSLLERYGNASRIIEKDGFDIAARVYNVLEGENLTSSARTTGVGIIELASVFERLSPHAVVTIADRFETMATAVAASYMNIPLIHIQGGEVTGNIDEKVRHAVSKLSDVHLVASENARARLIKMGEDPKMIFNTGCPSIDIARMVSECNVSGLVNGFDAKYGGVGKPVDYKSPYAVVMQHPVTTEYEKSRSQVELTLNVMESLNIPVIWFWPNVDAGSDGTSKGIRAFRERSSQNKFYFLKNMEPVDFLALLKNSMVLVGNSSVGIRECAYLGVPVVNIGSRQNGRVRGTNVIDVEHDFESLKSAILKQIAHGPYSASHLYGDGYSGQRIAEILAKVDLTINKQITY